MKVWALFYRSLGWSTALIGAALALRLAVTIAATPSDLWLDEFVPVTSSPSAAVTEGLPVLASRWISDPGVARTLIGDCVAKSASPLFELRSECAAAIEYGLATSPSSAELWLAQARLLANQGILGDRLAEALRNSFLTGRREGWIAAERLPLSLRLQEFLPQDMLIDIGADIPIVLQSRALSGPLIAAYIADPFLRESSWDTIEQFATLDQQEALIGWIRQAL